MYRKWCTSEGHSISRPSLSKIADFLFWLRRSKHLSVSAVRGYRSMLSAVFRAVLPEISTSPVRHDLLCSFRWSYFSIEIELNLRRHTLRGSGSVFARRVTHLFSCLQFRVYPSLIVAQSGGGDGFLFRPSKIPFLYVVRRWSPFASASGSVTLSDPLLPFLYIFAVLCILLLHISMYWYCLTISSEIRLLPTL